MRRYEDTTIWITGASSGIGEALAYALSREGAQLILSARRTAELERVRLACMYPEKIKVLPLDLAQQDQTQRLTETAWSLFGGIDILINNAGLSQRSLIIDTEFSVYRRMMEINYLGTIALTKSVLPRFIKAGGGHFVTVTSLMGRFGSPYRSGYCAAKHALHGFFDVLRMEHEKDGIAVSLICPGFVQTDVARNAITADGSPQKTNDDATAKGLSPEVFVRKMIRAMKRKKYEAYIGRGEVKGIYLKRFFPKLLHKVVMRSQVV